MKFNKIIAVSGKPGLFEVLSQTKAGVVVRSLKDGKRMPITATHNVSLLDNIAIYSYSAEIPLSEILRTIADKEENKECISHKEGNNDLITYFKEILPDYDEERVYASNIKKVIQWYNILVNSKFDLNSLKEKEASSNEEE